RNGLGAMILPVATNAMPALPPYFSVARVGSSCLAQYPGWRRSGCTGTVYAEPEDRGGRAGCHGPDGMLAAAHKEGEPDEIQQTFERGGRTRRSPPWWSQPRTGHRQRGCDPCLAVLLPAGRLVLEP